MSDQDNHIDSTRPLSYADLRRAIGLVALLVIGFMLAARLQFVLIFSAVTLILAMVFNPFVALLQRRGLKRGLAVALLGLILVGCLGAAFAFLLPPFLDQVQQLIQQAPDLWRRVYGQADQFLKRYPFIQQVVPGQPADLVQAAGSQVSGVATFLLRSTLNIVSGLVLVALCGLVLIFLLINPQPLVASFLEVVSPRYRTQGRRALLRMMEEMNAWARGVLINGAISAVTTGLLLAWIGVQPAYVFGVFAFMGEFVPIIGPVVVAVPALLVAASIGASHFFLALLAILFVQQVETNVLIPFVMGKQMDLHPVTIMFFTLAMGTLFGAVGAFLVMPTAALCKILVGEFYLHNRREDKRQFAEEALDIVSRRTKADG